MNKRIIKLKFMKFIFKYFEKRCNPYFFTKILKEEGIDVGMHTIFYEPFSQRIDRERPWMLKIGDYCKITKGVIILTHDYSRSVLRRAYGDIVGEAGVTSIGDNVFIGMNSIVLMGSNIGNNVIVGAGSVVHGNIPDNVVIAGNPAKIIRSLDEHYAIRKEKCIEEAKLYAIKFYERYNRCPSIKEMNCFFPLFLERDIDILRETGVRTELSGDDEIEIIEEFLASEPMFKNYSAFLEYCGIRK